jgi:hypothetical protein
MSRTGRDTETRRTPTLIPCARKERGLVRFLKRRADFIAERIVL